MSIGIKNVPKNTTKVYTFPSTSSHISLQSYTSCPPTKNFSARP
ncbi:hypothetical protein X975_00026, partial [Stegodyphus mimosarum]